MTRTVSFAGDAIARADRAARASEKLVEVHFRGALIADHVPTMAGGPRTSWAYSIGYIKALLAAVSAEKVDRP